MHDRVQHLLHVLSWAKENAECGLASLTANDFDQVAACFAAIVGDCERALSGAWGTLDEEN